jgi:orotate phosphoribosyltransferase
MVDSPARIAAVTPSWPDRRADLARQLITQLYREGMFRTWLRDKPDGWELISGTWSPFYITMRDVPSRPELFRLVVECAAELLKNEAPDANRLLGLASTGIPLAAAVAYSERLPMSFNRKMPNVRSLPDLEREILQYGGHSLVEGEFAAGDKVAILDDVVTLLDSKKIAMRQLQLEMQRRTIKDVKVAAVLVLVDRGRDTHQLAAAAGIPLKSLVRLRDGGLEMLRGVASETEIEVLRDYIENYENYQLADVQAELQALAAQKRDCRLVLEELAARSEDIVSASEAEELADATWSYGINTGDSRYSALSMSFRIIADEFQHSGALPATSLGAAVREIKRLLPTILYSTDSPKAALAAGALTESVRNRIAEWHE